MKKYKLSCNWSMTLCKLIKENKIDIDFIKAGEQKMFIESIPEMRALRPILLHGGLGHSIRTGMDGISEVNFKKLNNLIDFCGSPHYGIHIALTQDEYKKLVTEYKIYNKMTTVIRTFKDKLNIPLLLENTPDCFIDRRFYKFIPYVMPYQINQLLHDTDVGLLLDITHAKITAKFRGWNIYGYLNSLLLDRVKEIHINGCGCKHGVIMDVHKRMEKEDYDLLDWTLCRTSPDIISLEYNGTQDEEDDIVESSIMDFFNYFK